MKKITVLAGNCYNDSTFGTTKGHCKALSQHIWNKLVIEKPDKKIRQFILCHISQGNIITIITAQGKPYLLDYIAF